jgi:hypothetical protein
VNRLNRFRPSPAMIVACVALFVALGGVGYAAATIGSAQIKNNSVQGKDIKNSTITGRDVKNSSLTGSDIKNSSLAGRDVKNDSLSGSDILESSLGKVPAASSADNALSANSAKTVDDGAITPAKISGIPAVRASNDSGQSIAGDSPVTLAFTAETFDGANMHSNTVNNTRLTAPIAGIYSVTANVGWNSNNTGRRVIQLRKNGVDFLFDTKQATQGDTSFQSLTDLVQLAKGDFVEVAANQNSGAALGTFLNKFALNWVGP